MGGRRRGRIPDRGKGRYKGTKPGRDTCSRTGEKLSIDGPGMGPGGGAGRKWIGTKVYKSLSAMPGKWGLGPCYKVVSLINP